MEVINSATQMKITGAELTIAGSDKTGTSNSEGRIEITQLPASTIQGFITADGFTQEAFTITLTGVTSRVKISMTPMFNEAVVGSPQSTVGTPQVAVSSQ